MRIQLWESAPALRVVVAVLGVAFSALGLVLMVTTISFFVTVVRGTLAGSRLKGSRADHASSIPGSGKITR